MARLVLRALLAVPLAVVVAAAADVLVVPAEVDELYVSRLTS
jgi:hypothetical protein